MRTLSIAMGLALCALSASPSAASVLVVQDGLAATCFMSASTKRNNWTAIEECSSALDHELMTRDDRVATLVNRGTLRMRSGDLLNASRDFDHALSLDPMEPETWQSSNRALELQTHRPAVAYYIRGLAKEMTGDVEGAYADLIKARDLSPQWSDPALQLTRYKVVRR